MTDSVFAGWMPFLSQCHTVNIDAELGTMERTTNSVNEIKTLFDLERKRHKTKSDE